MHASTTAPKNLHQKQVGKGDAVILVLSLLANAPGHTADD